MVFVNQAGPCPPTPPPCLRAPSPRSKARLGLILFISLAEGDQALERAGQGAPKAGTRATGGDEQPGRCD